MKAHLLDSNGESLNSKVLDVFRKAFLNWDEDVLNRALNPTDDLQLIRESLPEGCKVRIFTGLFILYQYNGKTFADLCQPLRLKRDLFLQGHSHEDDQAGALQDALAILAILQNDESGNPIKGADQEKVRDYALSNLKQTLGKYSLAVLKADSERKAEESKNELSDLFGRAARGIERMRYLKGTRGNKNFSRYAIAIVIAQIICGTEARLPRKSEVWQLMGKLGISFGKTKDFKGNFNQLFRICGLEALPD